MPDQYMPIAAGSCVAFMRSVAQIAEDLRTVRPTILNSVPRIYERFYAKMQESLAKASGAKRCLFDLAQRVGWVRFCKEQGLPALENAPGALAMLAWPLLKAVVADKTWHCSASASASR
ncbi:MAG: hypothetical protein MO853_04905 [Candidatus Protistobacter heckmanni]|nr:hypothetical protein [Candidatus Protistobacter heckmanni]